MVGVWLPPWGFSEAASWVGGSGRGHRTQPGPGHRPEGVGGQQPWAVEAECEVQADGGTGCWRGCQPSLSTSSLSPGAHGKVLRVEEASPRGGSGWWSPRPGSQLICPPQGCRGHLEQNRTQGALLAPDRPLPCTRPLLPCPFLHGRHPACQAHFPWCFFCSSVPGRCCQRSRGLYPAPHTLPFLGNTPALLLPGRAASRLQALSPSVPGHLGVPWPPLPGPLGGLPKLRPQQLLAPRCWGHTSSPRSVLQQLTLSQEGLQAP